MKVLLLRFSAMGDLLLTTPVLRNWKRCRPDDELHLATKRAYAEVVQHSPFIDRLHLLDPAGSAGENTLPALMRAWRRVGFDAVLDLHQNWRSWQVRAVLRPPRYGSLDKRNLDKWRFVRSKAARFAVPHVVQRYLDAAAPFGITDDGQGLDANLDAGKAKQVLEALPEPFRSVEYHALVLGAKQHTKRIPEAVLQALVAQCSTPLVLIGGPEEASIGRNLAARHPDRLLNRAGKAGLQESAALLSGATRVLSGDTGMMHWAAALGKTVCSVWGSTHPALGMYPYYGGPDALEAYRLAGGAMAWVPGLDCRPCGKLGKSACPKGHFQCMKSLVPGDLAHWLETGQYRGTVLPPDGLLRQNA